MIPSIGDLTWKYVAPESPWPESHEAIIGMPDYSYLSIREWTKSYSVCLIHENYEYVLGHGMSRAEFMFKWPRLYQTALDMLTIEVDTVVL